MSVRKVFFKLSVFTGNFAKYFCFVSKTLSCGKIIFLVRGSLISYLFPFKRQLQKMVKPTEAICRVLPTNCLSVFENFVGLILKGLMSL